MNFKTERLTQTMSVPNKAIKVLIAEDNLLNQRIIEILIKKMGWDYTLVPDGQEAVNACLSDDYDVILMDIDMPRMNGWEATIEIRRQNIHIPIIAITAYSEESFRKKSFEAGMNEFLSKPYNKEEIYQTVLQYVKLN